MKYYNALNETRPYREIDMPIRKENEWSVRKWDDDLSVCYRVEYIDNEEDAKIWGEEAEGKYGLEPWDLYKKRRFHCLSEAMCAYMKFYMDEDITDVKMWMEVNRKGEVIYEETVEPVYGFKPFLRTVIDEGMKKEVDKTRNLQHEIQSGYDMMTEFINYQPHFKELYKQFVELKENGKLQ